MSTPLHGAVGIIATLLLAPSLLAAPLDDVMRLNQQGDWAGARETAVRLADDPEADPATRARACAMAAYSAAMLTDHDDATRWLDRFDRLSAALPERDWSRAEAARVRDQLAGNRSWTTNEGGGWNFPELVEEDGFWETTTPEAAGLNADALRDHMEFCRDAGADACLVVHGGTIVQEWYAPGCGGHVHAMSSTKSIASLLTGALIEDGKIPGIDTPVSEYLPEWGDGEKAEVTIAHLLSHTSGLANRAARGEEGVGGAVPDGDKNAYVRALSLDTEPGAAFSYSNEGAQLLSPILAAAAGEPLHLYAERRLFAPIGMHNTRLRLDEAGNAWTYADMITTPRDLARVGLLMRNTGRWNDDQIIGRAWIERSVRPAQKFTERCGWLWWINPEAGSFAAQGYLGTDIHVFPELDLIFVRVQAKPKDGANPGSAYRTALPALAARIAGG